MSEPSPQPDNSRAQVALDQVRSPHSLGNKLGRVAWAIVWTLLFRPSPRLCFGWRNLLLRLFGAKIGRGVHIYPRFTVWAPWNLRVDDHASVGQPVDCYNPAPVHLGANSLVSQYSYLCAATHDHTKRDFPVIMAPIVIGPSAWVAADVFIGMGVTIGEGAVVGARSSVYKDVEPWTVVAGNPAKFIKQRTLQESE